MTTTMAALNVPPLLALPREIRDMIIEDILLSPHPVPTPASQTIGTEEPKRWTTIDIPPIPLLSSLLHCNAQLRAETLQCAARLDTPLVLDILVLENGYVKCTWAQRPCKEHLAWQKIDMKVQVRTQPIRTKLWKEYCPTEETWGCSSYDHANRTDEMCDFPWDDQPSTSGLGHLIMMAVNKAIIGILWAELPGMCVSPSTHSQIRDRDATLGPVNSLQTVNIEFLPARGGDVGAAEMSRCDQLEEHPRTDIAEPGSEDSDPSYNPDEDLHELVATLASIMYSDWREGPQFEDPYCFLRVRNYKTDLQPLLSHVGSVTICTTSTASRTPYSEKLFLRGILEWLVGGGERAAKSYREILRCRKQMGWTL
jgi:hypothetical protein